MNWSFLKFGVKFMYLIENITVAILLQITELLMEPVFICQCNKLRLCFVVMYFLIPASAFSAFAWSLKQGNIFMDICKCCEGNPNPKPPENTGANKNAGDNNEKDCCKKCRKSRCCRRTCQLLSSCKTLYPAFCWVVILLIDGKYVGCALYSKCNSTMTIVDTKDLEMVHSMMRSKIWGLSAVGVFVVLYFICPYLVCCCRCDENRYEEMYMSQLEEDREEFARKYAKTCSERRHAQCEEKLRRVESQSGAAGGGDHGPNELDAETTVDMIKKCFDYSI